MSSRLLAALHTRTVHARRARVLASALAELIPRGHSVLDVGCGDGLIASLIQKLRPDLQLAGADVIVRPGARVDVTLFDGRLLPFADDSWDTVLYCDVLHHDERPVEMLCEGTRVARKMVLIKDHLADDLLARPRLRFMDFISNAPHGVHLPYNYLTYAEWIAAWRKCGLHISEVRRALRLYPWWAEPFFGSSLHFIASLDVSGSER